jgi:integrase
MRGQGRVYLPKHKDRTKQSRIWMLDYAAHGKQIRESSHMTSKRDALELLRQRIGKRKDGTLTGKPDRVTLADLRAGLERNYTLEGNVSWPRAAQAFKHLEDHFGAQAKTRTITKQAVAEYQKLRLAVGSGPAAAVAGEAKRRRRKAAARNSVRYEVAILSAAFSVAVENDLLATMPKFKKVAAGAARAGFFEVGEFAALVVELPQDIADLVRFLRLTGWRRGEGIGLQWAQVDWDDDGYLEEEREPVAGERACIRIGAAQTKGGAAREFPIHKAPELIELLRSRWQRRDGLRVFHRQGAPIGDFRKAWATACTKAGLVGRLVHDLRRTAARDFRKAGAGEKEIMELCGWESRDMFDRYNIIDAADLSRAVEIRFKSNQIPLLQQPAEQEKSAKQL